MAQIISPTELSIPFKLNVQRVRLTEEQFERLCQENPDLRIELSAQGELVIMPPTGLETGRHKNKLYYR
jgi:Uma2 family endonuclease